MIPPLRRLAALCVLGLLVPACVEERLAEQQDAGPSPVLTDLIATHRAEAEALTRNDKLLDALVQWDIVELLDPDNKTFRAKRRALEARIERQTERALEAAREAAERKDRAALEAALLRVLALDPENSEAREGLRAMEVAVIRRKRPKIVHKVLKPAPAVAEAEPKAAPEKAPAKVEKIAEVAEARNSAATTSDSAAASAEPVLPGLSALDDVAFQEAPLADAGTGSAIETAELAPEPEEARLGSLAPAIDLAKSGQHRDAIPELNAHLDRFPEDKDARGLLASSHRVVGFALYEDGKLRESLFHLTASEANATAPDPALEAALTDARSRLAKQAYEKGVRVFNSDVNEAIAHWEETLEFDPGHVRARSYLDKAYKIQETLSEIPAED